MTRTVLSAFEAGQLDAPLSGRLSSAADGYPVLLITGRLPTRPDALPPGATPHFAACCLGRALPDSSWIVPRTLVGDPWHPKTDSATIPIDAYGFGFLATPKSLPPVKAGSR